MKLAKVIAIALSISFCFGIGISMAQGMDATKLDIKAIRSIQVESKADGYYASIASIFENTSEKILILKDVKFDVTFFDTDKDGNRIKITVIKNGLLDELEIPGSTGEGTSGQAEKKLYIKLGPKDEATVEIMMQLFNMIGNPEKNIVMEVEGLGEVGVKMDKKKYFDTNKKAILEYAPEVQRDPILLK